MDDFLEWRAPVVWTAILAVGVALAPWFSGGQEPLAGLLSGGALLLAALLLWRRPAVTRLNRSLLTYCYGGLVAWSALSLIWSVNRYSTILWLVQLILAGVVFAVVFVLREHEPARRCLLGLYMALVVVFATFGFYLYVTGSYDRLTSSFYWANPAAAYILPAILLALDRRRLQGPRWGLWAAIVVITAAAFVLADSRGAALVLAFVGIIFMALQRPKKTYWIKFVFIVLMVILVVMALVQGRHLAQPKAVVVTPGSRFAEAASGESQSASDRWYYLTSTAKIWWDRPILGTGGGTFADVHPKYQGRVVSASTSAHNLYAQVLAELGIVGGLLIVLTVLALLWGMGRGAWRQPERWVLVLGALALLMHFGLDIDARYPTLWALIALFAGLGYEPRRVRLGRPGPVVPVLALAVMVPLASLYQSDVWAQRGRSAQSDGDLPAATGYFNEARLSGFVYNPDVVNAAGIDYYSEAASGVDPKARQDAAEALRLARAAEHQDSFDGQHHQLEGRVLALTGDLAGAESALQTALWLDPYDHPGYALDLAGIQLRRGRPDDAVATAQHMLAQYPAKVRRKRAADVTLPSTLAQLAALVGNIRLEQGRFDDARAASAEANAIDANDLHARALVVKLRKSRGPIAQ